MPSEAKLSRTFFALVNPAAGGGKCGKRAAEAVNRLREGGLSVDVWETSRAGEATEIARSKRAEGYRHFIAVGGDGTSYEVVNGLFPEAAAGPRVSLGFLPMGTGNSFLRDFTEEGAEHSIKALLEGRSQPCDVVRLTHTRGAVHYINLLSVGFVADVCSLANRRFKRLGEAGYGLGVVSKVVTLKPTVFRMRVDGGAPDDEPVTFVSVSNSRFTGGKMMMAPEADTADGQADLVRVGRMGRIALLRTFPKIFEGTHVDHPRITQTRVRTVDFELDHEIDVMIDGEVLHMQPTRLEVLPGALDVRV